MNTLDAIFTRRSIRKYRTDPVPQELIELMLKAAMSAPSAGNQQPWEFIVVDDSGILKKIPQIHPYVAMCAEAPLGIVICGNTQREKFPGFWVQDCSAATQNLLLAAHEKGLGAVWTGIHPLQDRVRAFRELLGIPSAVIPLALVVMGYPAQEAKPQDRYRPERVHHNGW